MTKVLIIGATGSIARVARQALLQQTDVDITLFSRRVNQLPVLDASRESVVKGDLLDTELLKEVLKDQDIVYANLAGPMDVYAQAIVSAMEEVGPKRLIFITTMGIYQEIPSWLGESPEPYSNPILRPFRKAADIIESSSLAYTIIRPGWLDNGNDTIYELTRKGEEFGGMGVSRKSVADVIVRLVTNQDFGLNESFGINRPE